MPPARKDEGIAFGSQGLPAYGPAYARFRKSQDFGQPAAGKSMGKGVIAELLPCAI